MRFKPVWPLGRLLSQRFLPALPITLFLLSMLDTLPKDARHRRGTSFSSFDGSRNRAILSVLSTNCAHVPAARTSCAPFPGRNSTLCTKEPMGRCSSGYASPGFSLAIDWGFPLDAVTTSPTSN